MTVAIVVYKGLKLVVYRMLTPIQYDESQNKSPERCATSRHEYQKLHAEHYPFIQLPFWWLQEKRSEGSRYLTVWELIVNKNILLPTYILTTGYSNFSFQRKHELFQASAPTQNIFRNFRTTCIYRYVFCIILYSPLHCFICHF